MSRGRDDCHPADCRCSACALRRATRAKAPPGVMYPDELAKLPRQPPWQWALSYALVEIGDLAKAFRERLEGAGAPASSPAPETASEGAGLRYVDPTDPTAAELAALEAQEGQS